MRRQTASWTWDLDDFLSVRGTPNIREWERKFKRIFDIKQFKAGNFQHVRPFHTIYLIIY